ncbi:hypothetical protein GCM10023196_068420 [Actinoallomurus vinaceus]|uniref:Calcineurin-like phosphoesterase domain-containing protein n=1 Tax=Actinoallomurus vinaceus TaxID=1080074 RepID=A0ABP8ULL3_9ACTN
MQKSNAQPLFITMHDAHPSNKDYQHSFVLYHQVSLKNWIVHVVGHVHVKEETNGYYQFAGNTFIPGYANWQYNTPQFIVDQAPQFDPNVHKYDRTVPNTVWASNAAASNDFYAGANRYPRSA